MNTCIDCGKSILDSSKRCRKCCNADRATGKDYKNIYINGKCIREHRYIMEQILGRKLLSFEHVHHINGDIRDNQPKNLQLLTHGTHSIITHTGRHNTKETKEKMRESAKKARAKDQKPRYPKDPEKTSKKHSEYKKNWWDSKHQSGEITSNELSERKKKVRAGRSSHK